MSQIMTSKVSYKMSDVGRNFDNTFNKYSLLKLALLAYLVV